MTPRSSAAGRAGPGVVRPSRRCGRLVRATPTNLGASAKLKSKGFSELRIGGRDAAFATELDIRHLPSPRLLDGHRCGRRAFAAGDDPVLLDPLRLGTYQLLARGSTHTP